MKQVISSGSLTVGIDTTGAELISVRNQNGHEYIWSGEQWGEHSPLLFPICGRILEGKYTYGGKEYHMLPHGFAKRCEFVISEQSDDRLVLTLKDNEQTREQYPFAFTLTAEFSVHENKLDAVFTVKNDSDVVMPFMLGWHPGFTLEGNIPLDSFYVDFGNVDALKINRLQNGPFVDPVSSDYPLNNGRYYLNNDEIAENDTLIFHGTLGSATLTADGAHSITLGYGENTPYFCLWKHPSESARYLCLEPWSGVPADGVTPENFEERRMSRLAPNESESFRYNVDFN